MRPCARARWLALSLCLTAACSGGREPECASDDACPGGTVCQLDGSCSPLSTASDARFARHLRLEALDWGSVRRADPTAAPADDGSLEIGGDEGAAAYLSFGPLPEDVDLLDAILTLHPVAGSIPGPRSLTFVVGQTRPFRSHRLSYRSAPPTTHWMLRRRLEVSGGRPLHFDLGTPGVRRDQDRHRTLYLVVRAADREGAPLRLASPRSPESALRPRLDIRVR